MRTRSERTRRSPIPAGARQFSEHGRTRAALERIAADAGLTKGALYFHSTSKEALADAVRREGGVRLAGFQRDGRNTVPRP